MATISDGLKDVFLAGVGVMAITGEKAKELADTLVSKGAVTVEQGREINSELRRKASEKAESVMYDALEARMSVMTPEERTAFAAKAAEIAARPAATQTPVEVVIEKVEDAAFATADKVGEAVDGATAAVKEIVDAAKVEVSGASAPAGKGVSSEELTRTVAEELAESDAAGAEPAASAERADDPEPAASAESDADAPAEDKE